MVYKSLVLGGALFSAAMAACPFKTEGGDCPHALSEQQPEHTKMGCTCKTACAASNDKDGFNCDWCYTEEPNCGTSSKKGKWDFCAYDADPTYEKQSWDTKLTDLWKEVKANTTSGVYPNVLAILTESVQTSFDRVNDVMPEGRLKYIHSVGTVCKFTMKVSKESPFSGVLEAGNTAHGLVRLGSALAVDEKSGIVPGIGVKLMRSGVPSGNFVGLNTLDALPDKSYNFFELPMSNHLPAPDSAATKIIAKKFGQASNCPTKVGLSDICQYTQNGSTVKSVNFPFKLVLDSPFTLPRAACTQAELQEKLVNVISAGSVLYNVTTFTSPTDSFVIGQMVTDEACVNSAFGDGGLFFKHQLIEEDWNQRPDFVPTGDAVKDCGVPEVSVTPPPQCNA